MNYYMHTGCLYGKKRRLRGKLCQENSWWMKSAAIFATAGFTSVRTWAENALYTRTTMIQLDKQVITNLTKVFNFFFFLQQIKIR